MNGGEFSEMASVEKGERFIGCMQNMQNTRNLGAPTSMW